MKLALVIGPLVLAFLASSAVVVGRQLLLTNPPVARAIGYPMPVRVVAAEQVDLTESIGANGDVQPITLVNLTAKTSVQVKKVTVDLGDLVAPGQVLIQFDRQLPSAALATAKSAMRRASAGRDRAAHDLRHVKAIYEQGLPTATLAAAKTALDQATADLARAVEYLRRIEAIYAQNLLPKIELEKAQATVDETKARYKLAEENLLLAKKDLQVYFEKAQATAEEAQLRYKQAEEELVRAKHNLQDTTLVSPVPGIIMERQIQEGEISRPNQPLVAIGQIDQVLVEAKVAEDRLQDIYLKQPATVTFNAFPNDEFEGEIVKIKPVTDTAMRTFLVYIKLANPELKLKPGLSSFIRIKQAHRSLAVPNISLINPTGVRESAVFVVENGSVARLRRVKIGVVSGGMTQVLDGLAPRELVVTVGQLHLRDEDQVRIGDEFDELKSKPAAAPQANPNSMAKSY